MKRATANFAYTEWQKKLEKISRIVVKACHFWVDNEGKIWFRNKDGYYLWLEGGRLSPDQIEIFVRNDKVYLWERDLKRANGFKYDTKCPFEDILPVYIREHQSKEKLLDVLEAEEK